MKALLQIAISAWVAASLQAKTPNIVVILADDLGYGDLGCYGSTKISTPEIDKLAKRGLRFTFAYAPSATCTPSRYALMTGCYAWRQEKKQTSILDGDAPLSIDPKTPTLPSILRAAGYKTGLVGKWHLGLGDGVTPVDFNSTIRPGPLETGFDEAFFIPATVDRVPSVWIKDHRVANLDPTDPIKVSYIEKIGDEPTGSEHPELLKQKADKQHSGTIHNGISRIGWQSGGKAARFIDEKLPSDVVSHATSFITANKDNPFFLLVGLFELHVPRTVDARFKDSGACGVRGDTIRQIDWETGEILASLEKNGLTENTLVVLSSDNGPVLFDGYYDDSIENLGGHTPADGLRGGKYQVYEGGIRVPFIASWPGHIAPGTSDSMISLLDLTATFAALASTSVPPSAAIDSIDQSADLLGTAKTPARTSIIGDGIWGLFALRQGDWKYIPSNKGMKPGGIGSGADPNDKRFADALVTEDALYDLKSDPAEQTNLAISQPERVIHMKSALLQMRANLNKTTSLLPNP